MSDESPSFEQWIALTRPDMTLDLRRDRPPDPTPPERRRPNPPISPITPRESR